MCSLNGPRFLPPFDPANYTRRSEQEKGAKVESSITYFDHHGRANTPQVLELVRARATALGITDVVVPSVEGTSALLACERLAGLHVVVVTQSSGFARPGHQEMPEDVLEELKARGASVFRGTHSFGGVGRAVRRKFATYQVEEIIAQTLKRFGEGTKVAVEASLAAADAGLISPPRETISCGGTGRGLDTALVLRPSHAQDFFDLEILEIICKPRNPK